MQTNGVYVNQNWNDHRKGTDEQGHMAHMAERSRRLGSAYFSGVDGNGTTDYVTITSGSPDTIDFKFVRFLYRVDIEVQPVSTPTKPTISNKAHKDKR